MELAVETLTAFSSDSSYLRERKGLSQKEWTVLMVEKASSASMLAAAKIGVCWFSIFTPRPMQTPTDTRIAGTMLIVINVSFH